MCSFPRSVCISASVNFVVLWGSPALHMRSSSCAYHLNTVDHQYDFSFMIISKGVCHDDYCKCCDSNAEAFASNLLEPNTMFTLYLVLLGWLSSRVTALSTTSSSPSVEDISLQLKSWPPAIERYRADNSTATPSRIA